MMKKGNQDRVPVDPRTWLLLCLLGIFSILCIHSEAGGACLFFMCLLLHLFAGKADKILPYLMSYAIFYGIGWIGVWLLDGQIAFSFSSMLSSIGIVGRKILIPFSFACALAEEPTGSLMAAFLALRFPKAAGIAAAVLLRFFPTISEEYRAIRSSQRFRGIGVGVFHTLTHLPSTAEYILIPLILRTTKVAEELSCSVTVRGVRFSGKTISYRPLSFTCRDFALCLFMLLTSCAVFILEKGGVL